MKPLKIKSFTVLRHKTNSNLAVKVAERSNSSFSVNLINHLGQTSVLFNT